MSAKTTIAVVGDATLAVALSDYGLGVLGGSDDFSQDSKSVTAALREGRKVSAVLVVDGPGVHPAARTWVALTSQKAPTAILRSAAPSSALPLQTRALETSADEAFQSEDGGVSLAAVALALDLDMDVAAALEDLSYPLDAPAPEPVADGEPAVASAQDDDDDDDDDDDALVPAQASEGWDGQGEKPEAAGTTGDDEWGDFEDDEPAAAPAPVQDDNDDDDDDDDDDEWGDFEDDEPAFVLPPAKPPHTIEAAQAAQVAALPPTPAAAPADPLDAAIAAMRSTGMVVTDETISAIARSMGLPDPNGETQEQGDQALYALTSPGAAVAYNPLAARLRSGQCTTVFATAGKGGVGKSLMSVALAQYAATHVEGMRVILIDMNRGQGDLRTFLRLSGMVMPDIYQVAITGQVDKALVSPTAMTAMRGAQYGEPGFGFIAAPRDEDSDWRVVTSEVYRRAIAWAQANAHLVIVDTQIMESHDTSGLFDDVTIPMLASNPSARLLGVANESAAGYKNLRSRLDMLTGRYGVPEERLIVALNDLADADENTLRALRDYIGYHGAYAGAVGRHEEIKTSQSAGLLDYADHPDMVPVLAEVLYRATGMEIFAEQALAAQDRPGRGTFGGLGILSRLFKGRK